MELNATLKRQVLRYHGGKFLLAKWIAEKLKSIKGMAVVSGYRSELYDHLYKGWETVERVALADGAKKRTEVLWISPNVK